MHFSTVSTYNEPMTQERWNNILGDIQEKFEILHHSTEELEGMPGSCEMVEFESPLGKIRMEFTTKPLVLDKKVTASRRIGSQASVEYTYSDTELTHKMTVYKWNEAADAWEEIKASAFFS